MSLYETASEIRARIERETGPLPTPQLAYWLCGTPRTGSNMLQQALKKAGCGRPAEGFHTYANRQFGWGFDESDFIRYNRQMIERQTHKKTGIFGLKIFWEHFQYYLHQCDQPAISGSSILTPHEKVAVFFPDVRFIYLRRKDKLRQAISLVKAKQSSIFAVRSTDGAAQNRPPRLRYKPKMISYYLGLLTAQDLLWQVFFDQGALSPFTIWYEDLADDYESKTREVYAYLGYQSTRVGQVKLKKQADALSDEWYQRYLGENPWLTDPGDALSILANDHLRKLRPADGQQAVSLSLWMLRFRHLMRDPVGYLKRIRMR